jgi:hypothetical protein
MQVVDTRGRLFGAINLIDLGVLLFVVLLVPLGYGAYVLFHTSPPRVTAVVPSSLEFVRGAEQHVQIAGQHLRPYLRAKIGASTASAYVVQTPEAAEIRFSDMTPGTYDVILLDESQEVARLPNALTILPPPVQALGFFTNASAADKGLVRGVKWGAADHPIAELLDVEPPHDAGKRRATLRVICQWSPADNLCTASGAVVRVGAELILAGPGAADRSTFVINELRVDATWLHVKVRLMGVPDALDKARLGDVDTSALDSSAATAGSPIPGVTSGAILLSLGERLKNQGSYAVTATRVQPGAALNAFNVISAAVPVDAQAAELLVPVPPTLVYRGVAMRPGNILAFETKDYRLESLVVSTSGS